MYPKMQTRHNIIPLYPISYLSCALVLLCLLAVGTLGHVLSSQGLGEGGNGGPIGPDLTHLEQLPCKALGTGL